MGDRASLGSSRFFRRFLIIIVLLLVLIALLAFILDLLLSLHGSLSSVFSSKAIFIGKGAIYWQEQGTRCDSLVSLSLDLGGCDRTLCNL